MCIRDSDQPGEPGELRIYREASLDTVDWNAVDAVLVSTHEYQALALARIERVARRGTDVLALYDDAGDSLLHVLPERWAMVNPLPAGRGVEVDRSVRLPPCLLYTSDAADE